MRQSHLILWNALIIWANRILVLVPQLIVVPYIIGTIGESGYGVYALIWSLLLAVDRLEQSLQSGVVKYSAAFLAEARIDEVNRIVSSSFVYSILLAVVGCAGICTAAVFSGDPTGDLGVSLFVVGGLILLIVPLTPYIAVIQSRQCYFVGVCADTLSKYISLAAIVIWFNLMTPSVWALIIITTVTLMLSRLAQVPVAYRMVPGLRNRLSLFDWRAFRLILAFGSVTVFVALCGIMNNTGIRWLMASFVSTSFVAHLAIILMPGLLLIQILQAMTITIMPATSRYKAMGNDFMLKELLIRSMRYASILTLAGLLVVTFLVKDMLRLWVGPTYTFLTPYMLALFASTVFLMSTSSAHHMLNGLGKLRITLFNSLVGQVLVPFTLIFAVYLTWRNPYIAVTAGVVTGNIIWGIMQIGFATKIVHADLRETIARVYTQPLIVAAAVAASTFGLITYGGVEGLWGRLGLTALAVILFFSGVYVFFASVAERQQIEEICGLVWNRLSLSGRRERGRNRQSYDKFEDDRLG